MRKILSVIVPMYNSRVFIEKCLNSLLLDNAGMQLLEILVVNDGSTDGCENLVLPYVRQYPDTFRLFSQKNGGHGAAVNRGVRMCSGTYFKVLDADDWLSTPALRQLVECLDVMGQADVILNAYQTYDIRTAKTEHFEAGSRRMLSMGEVTAHWNTYKWLFSLHGIIYRTEFYRACGWELPEHVFYDDAFFYTVYASYANNIAIAGNEVLYVYRIGDVNQSVSRKNRESRIDQLEKVIDAMLETYADQKSKSSAGQTYWNRKMETAVCDYYITSFLRFENRRDGRRKAKDFTAGIKKNYPKIFAGVRKKYWILRVMGFLRMDENNLKKLVNRGGTT